MTPIEQIEQIRAKRDVVPELVDTIFIVMSIAGLGLIFSIFWIGWVAWFVGVILNIPNFVLTIHKAQCDSKIDEILKREAEKELREKYG